MTIGIGTLIEIHMPLCSHSEGQLLWGAINKSDWFLLSPGHLTQELPSPSLLEIFGLWSTHFLLENEELRDMQNCISISWNGFHFPLKQDANLLLDLLVSILILSLQVFLKFLRQIKTTTLSNSVWIHVLFFSMSIGIPHLVCICVNLI